MAYAIMNAWFWMSEKSTPSPQSHSLSMTPAASMTEEAEKNVLREEVLMAHQGRRL